MDNLNVFMDNFLGMLKFAGDLIFYHLIERLDQFLGSALSNERFFLKK